MILLIVLATTVVLTVTPSATAQSPTDTESAIEIFNQAQDAHEKGDLATAIALYRKSLKVMPEFPEAAYQLGVAELAAGNTSEAESSFRRASELRPTWTLPMISLGSLLVQTGQLDESERLLQTVLAADPQNPPALTALVDLRIKMASKPAILKDLLGQITALTSKANPTASLWSARAALESALGNIPAAKASLANAASIDPRNMAALFQLADIALAEGDLNRAAQIGAQLKAISPGLDTVKLLNARILAQSGKYEDAVAEIGRIQKPTDLSAELLRKIEAARSTSPAELERRLVNDPKDASILGRLCSMYRRSDPKKALDYCRRASAAEPNNIEHAIGFGAALVQAQEYEAAVTLFRKLLAIVPDNFTVHGNLATALFQLKRYPEAKVEFLWLTTAQPKSAGAYLFLGIIYDKLGEYMDAAANYQIYLRLADQVNNRSDIDKVNLRLPELQKLIGDGHGR